MKVSAGKLWIRMAIGAALFCAGGLQAKMYSVNTAKSELTWVGKKVSGQHNGTVMIKEGSFDLAANKGSFVMDMNTIKVLDLSGEWKDKLEGHLKSDDFFNISKYPTSKFVVKKAEKKGDKYMITGDLTVKNITKPVSFTADWKEAKDSGTLTAKFEIDRTKWDIKYNSGSFFDVKKLGDKLIYDPIEIGFNIQAQVKKNQS